MSILDLKKWQIIYLAIKINIIADIWCPSKLQVHHRLCKKCTKPIQNSAQPPPSPAPPSDHRILKLLSLPKPNNPHLPHYKLQKYPGNKMIKNVKEGYAKFYHLTIRNIANIVSEVLERHEFKINLFFIFYFFSSMSQTWSFLILSKSIKSSTKKRQKHHKYL